LRYRPRSLSYRYDRDKCQHPNLKPLGLVAHEQVLLREAEDYYDNEFTGGESSTATAAATESPVLPVPANAEEWTRVEILEEMTNRFELSPEHLKHFEKRMVDEINRGLDKRTHKDANVKSFVTYVSKLPTGRESGNYLALDLGGTNFRVILAELTAGTRSVKIKSCKFQVSRELMLGPGEDLFDFMASKLEDFMVEHNLIPDEEEDEDAEKKDREAFHLGFTFSFPTRQRSLDKAELAVWTKGYACAGVQGKDIGLLLRQAIAKRPRLNIKVDAILNDTTGCLMACAYKHPECRIGVIVGTGTNAAYVENLDNVGTYEGDKPAQNSSPGVVINTEWGAFGNTGSLDIFRTTYDHNLDKQSLNPGKQVYEKLISGMYLGELTRLIIVDGIKRGALTGFPLSVFEKPRVFDTRHISAIEDDDRNEFKNMEEALLEIGMTTSQFQSLTAFDKTALRYLCERVTDRAARLAGAGVAALANKINRPKLTVGMDGSVYKFHPNFGRKMKAVTRKLVCNCIDFKMVLSEDGSGRGAALAVAAQTSKFDFLR